MVSASRPRASGVPRGRGRMVPRSSDARDGEGVLGREPMEAHTRGGSVPHRLDGPGRWQRGGPARLAQVHPPAGA